MSIITHNDAKIPKKGKKTVILSYKMSKMKIKSVTLKKTKLKLKFVE